MSELMERLRGINKPTSVLYLDLDGTVRKGFDELGRFVNKREDVEVFQEIPKILKLYKDNEWRIVAISNQGGIALGHVTFQEMNHIMIETNRQCNYLFDKIAWCSHHPDASTKEMAICWCRKPRIGLIVETVSDLSLEFGEYYPPHLSLFIGDRPEDKGCAENANIEFIPAKIFREWTLKEHEELIKKIHSMHIE